MSDRNRKRAARARAARLRPARNRKLKQRRPFRLPRPSEVATRVAAVARRSAPLLLILAAVLVGTGVLLLGTWFATTSSRFAVREVTVRGTARATAESVRAAAAIPEGENIFLLSLDEVERRVAAHPWVATATASRRLPDEIEIEVTERQPAALVLLDAPYLADARGRVFKRARLDRGEGDDLVVVTGIDRSLYARHPEAGARAVVAAMDAAARWHREPSRPHLSEVHVSSGGLTLYTVEGAVGIRLGRDRGPDLEERFERYDAVWSALSPEEREQARMIFLDNPTRPDRVTVRLADARPLPR